MSTVKMVAKCGKCGGEFVDGTVFCEHCGERIMVGVPDGFEDGRPFFAYQWMGEVSTHSETSFALRYVLYPTLMFAISAVFAAAVMGTFGILLVVLCFVLYCLVTYALLLWYRRRGAPLGFAERSPYPSSEESAEIEADWRKKRE